MCFKNSREIPDKFPQFPDLQANCGRLLFASIYMEAKLFVGNLTFTATENDLQDYFAQAGVVVSVNIMQDRMTGRSRGFAFVEMGSKEDAEKAIQMFHSKDFQGRPLTVTEARPREYRPAGEWSRRAGRGSGEGDGYRGRGDQRGDYRQ